jgi:hypothetical protein
VTHLHLRAEQVVDWATRGGARALGRNDVGRLEPGAKADVVLIKNDASPVSFPLLNPYGHVAFQAQRGDVHTVIVDGKVVKHEHRLVGVHLAAVRRTVGATVEHFKPGRPLTDRLGRLVTESPDPTLARILPRSPYDRRMWRGCAVVGMSFVTALLVSCSAPGDASAGATASVAATAQPTAEASVVATAQPTAQAQPIPEGVVASGTFKPADGSTTGTVDVVVTGNLVELVLRDLKSTHKRLGVRAPFGDSKADPCVDGPGFEFADIVAGTPTDPLNLPLEFGRGDPTFISEIALHSPSAQADRSSDCINQVVARAPLVWTFGPLRPYLDTLVDGGTRSGAGGKVVIDATGRPVAYTVAPNDLLSEVAGRFGITPDDAFYLNPARAGSPEAPMLLVNEVLNLKLAKHRNGPTGEVQLWFKKRQTRFVSYAGERYAEAG